MTMKERALADAMAKVERQFGKGSVFNMGNRTGEKIPVIPTGSLALDVALGVGGLPKGRIIEIYGPESSGKTTISLSCIAQAQKMGEKVLFVDAEHALDPTWAAKLGVNVDDLIVSQPDNGEQALEITDMFVASGAVGLIVVDSVAALVPRAEIEGEMGDSHVGLQARLMSQALRKLTSAAAKTGTTIIFINQLREKIGVFFGNPETTTGGKALKFYASVRIDVRKGETIKGVGAGAAPVGHKMKVKTVKNKVAPPFKTAETVLLYTGEVSREGDIVTMGKDDGIISRSGSWYSYGDTQLGQGENAAIQYLRDNPAVAEEIVGKIMVARGVAGDTIDPVTGEVADDYDPTEDTGF